MNRRLLDLAVMVAIVVVLFSVLVPVIPAHPNPRTDTQFTLWESVSFYLFRFGGVYGFCGQYAFTYGSQFGMHCV